MKEKTAEDVTMRDIAVLCEWAAAGERRKKYLQLAKRAESSRTGSGWSALKAIAKMINERKGPWAPPMNTEES